MYTEQHSVLLALWPLLLDDLPDLLTNLAILTLDRREVPGAQPAFGSHNSGLSLLRTGPNAVAHSRVSNSAAVVSCSLRLRSLEGD